jgi:hypothetical protein
MATGSHARATPKDTNPAHPRSKLPLGEAVSPTIGYSQTGKQKFVVAPLLHALTPCQAVADSGHQLAGSEWFDKISLPSLATVSTRAPAFFVEDRGAAYLVSGFELHPGSGVVYRDHRVWRFSGP